MTHTIRRTLAAATVAAAAFGSASAAFAQDAMAADKMMAKDKMSADAGMMKKDAMMAQHFVAYSDEVFAAAQKAGKRILVDVYADWCPVCKNQHIILDKLMSDPAYSKAVFLQVNFDKQKDAVAKFKAKNQSTLITFDGAKETGRISYTADRAKVTALAAKVKSS